LQSVRRHSAIICKFKVCKSVHHRTIQINHQPDAKIFQFIFPTFIYNSTCFGPSPAHHQELNDCSSSLWFYLRIVMTVVLCSWWGRARPRAQHGCHHDTKVNPEAATAVIELLMMGGRTPETFWAVNKRQDNKLENCCIRLVIYLNSAIMLTNTVKNIKYSNLFSRTQWHFRYVITRLSGWTLHPSRTATGHELRDQREVQNIASSFACLFCSPVTATTLFNCIINTLKPELNPICYLLALLGAHHFLHVSRIRVKSLTFWLLMS